MSHSTIMREYFLLFSSYFSLAASLEPLAHCRNVASWSLFYMYYFGKCSSELAQLVPFLASTSFHFHFWGRSSLYSDRLHDFSVTIPPLLDAISMSISTFSFLAQLDSRSFCQHNVFYWPMIYMALSLEVTDTFYL